MYRKIRCDRKSWKIFDFQDELNKALLLLGVRASALAAVI